MDFLMTEIKAFLKEMISLPGLSGFEEPIRKCIEKTWKPLSDEMEVSPVGSLHALKRGEGKEPRARILLAAHMDAIGFMVTTIEQGFLHFTEIGGFDVRLLPGQPVIVHGRKDLPGVIAQPPERLLPPDHGNEVVKIASLLIDVGLPENEVKALVQPGDIASYSQEPIEIGEDLLAGHSIDNRGSVAVVTACLDELQHLHHVWDVWAVATVQEEENCTGAATSPFEIRPRVAVAIDMTFAKSPGSEDYRSFPLGKGITIGWGPNVHPALSTDIQKLARELEIPFGMELMPRHSGTDAYAMQIVAEGIPTLVVSVPGRYMHSPIELVSMKDILRAGRLLAEWISRFEPDFASQLRWEVED
jgi:putative aminopeptidase FrvX